MELPCWILILDFSEFLRVSGLEFRLQGAFLMTYPTQKFWLLRSNGTHYRIVPVNHQHVSVLASAFHSTAQLCLNKSLTELSECCSSLALFPFSTLINFTCCLPPYRRSTLHTYLHANPFSCRMMDVKLTDKMVAKTPPWRQMQERRVKVY